MGEKGSGKRGRIRQYIKRKEFLYELVILLAAALCARAQFADGISPFGIAFLAAVSISRLSASYACAGAICGYVFLQPSSNLGAACVCALFFLLLFLWEKCRGTCDQFEMLLLLFFSQISLLPVFYSGGTKAFISGLISLGVSVLSALILQNALRALRSLGKRHVLTDGEQVSISVSFGILLMSVTDCTGYGFSLPVVLLLAFSMIAVYARGIGGVAVAVALGVMMMIGGKFSLSFIGGIAACALAGAAVRSLDTLGIVGGFVGCSLLVGTHVYSAPHTVNLMNLGAAGTGFLLLSRERLLALCACLDAGKERERYARKVLKRMRECTAFDMRNTSAVIREIAHIYQPKPPDQEPTNALMQWTAQAAYGACGGCPLKKICWKDWERSSAAILSLLQSMERGERLRARRPFDPNCRHMSHLASAAWQAQNQYLVQCSIKKQAGRQHAFINRQMQGVSEILDGLAERVLQDRWLDEDLEQTVLRGLDKRGYRVYGVDALYPGGKVQLHIRMPAQQLCNLEPFTEAMQRILRRPIRVLRGDVDGKQCTLVLEEAQQLVADMGTATLPLSDSGISGDSTGERRMARGKVLYALSDGMGAGETAKGESDSALRLLFDLYEAGFSRDVTLESVNRLLLERSEDMYATLDAVYLDLRSGDAEFMKYGAPPSFVYRGSKLHTVCAEALPAGILDEAVPAVSKAKLKRRDTVVLFSDGALDALGEDTKSAIESVIRENLDSQQAAQTLLEKACEKSRNDDMTVMVIKIA